MCRKVGRLLCGGGGAWSLSNTTWSRPRPTSLPVASGSIQPFDKNRHGPKNWGLCLFFGGELDPHQHNVAWAEPYLHTKWHLDPSNCLATATIYTNVTDSTGQTTVRGRTVFGRHFVNGSPMLSDRCLSVCLSVCLPYPVLSCLSMTLVYCCQTVG